MQLPEIFKIKKHRWVNGEGKRVKASTQGAIKKLVQSKDWYADVPIIEAAKDRIVRRKHGDKKENRKRVRLCQNKRAAKEMLRGLIEAAEKKAAGIVDHTSISQQSLGALIDRYKGFVQAKGSGDDHVDLTIARLESICHACRFIRVRDLNAEAVANWLYRQRQEEIKEYHNVCGVAKSYRVIAEKFNVKEQTVTYWRQQGAPIVPRGKTDLAELSRWYNVRNSRSMGAGTSNHYVTAIKGFGRWLVKSAKAIQANPFEDLDKVDARTDVRKSRRILETADFAKLTEAARKSQRVFRKLSGIDRAMIYILAAYTGLRASEIASLQRHSFCFDSQPATVRVAPAYTKNSEIALMPLRSDLATSFESYLSGRDFKKEVIWPGTWSEDGAKMIRIDLAAARLEYTDANGDDYDFHALRHQFISDLAKAGVSLSAAQELARHSKPELTANVYTHLSLKDTAMEVEKLSNLPTEIRKTPANIPESDFGPAHGPASFAIQAHLSDKPATGGKALGHEKTPENTRFTGVLGSDADGTRTRNHRIDSPVL